LPIAHLYVDYQNVHFTAWECFSAYGTPVYQCLIDPGKFADQVLAARLDKGYQAVDLTEIHVFRGWPSRRNEGAQHARVQRQASNWTRDRRVKMHLRTLQYPRDWPETPANEKGVDVDMAIEVVRAGITGTADVIVVATRDTDIVPAIELVSASTGASVELAGWHGQSELKVAGASGSVLLQRPAFNRSRDTRNYA
jgi:uncharacterized LabA/DUF88 family protein